MSGRIEPGDPIARTSHRMRSNLVHAYHGGTLPKSERSPLVARGYVDAEGKITPEGEAYYARMAARWPLSAVTRTTTVWSSAWQRSRPHQYAAIVATDPETGEAVEVHSWAECGRSPSKNAYLVPADHDGNPGRSGNVVATVDATRWDELRAEGRSKIPA